MQKLHAVYCALIIASVTACGQTAETSAKVDPGICSPTTIPSATTYVYVRSDTAPELIEELEYAARTWSAFLCRRKLQVVIDDTKTPNMRFLDTPRPEWGPDAAGYGVVNTYMEVWVQPTTRGSSCSTRGILLHEMGHFIGLAHTPEGEGVMQPTCNDAGDELTQSDLEYCIASKRCLPRAK